MARDDDGSCWRGSLALPIFAPHGRRSGSTPTANPESGRRRRVREPRGSVRPCRPPSSSLPQPVDVTALKICPTCSAEYPANERFCPRDGTALRAQGAAGADLVGAIVAERYHVVRKLGEGGMGTVYLAEHVKMGRIQMLVKSLNLSLKVLKNTFSMV